jgi:hypothetical protein
VISKDDGLKIGQDELSRNLLALGNYKKIYELCLGEKLKGSVHMYGGFYFWPQDCYQNLRKPPRQESEKTYMSSAGHINQLNYDYPLLFAQSKHARFINTGMMVTLSGAVVSDGLEDGRLLVVWVDNIIL